MSLITSVFRSRDTPRNRTAGSAYAFFMGGSTAGKLVNERSAMQMAAVYACVRALSEAVAGLPLHLYRYTDDGGKEKAMDEKSSIRAKVEHVFAVVKGLFRFRKTRYRGLRKQTEKLNMMFALANLYLADKRGLLA